jgi:hypothetical protein
MRCKRRVLQRGVLAWEHHNAQVDILDLVEENCNSNFVILDLRREGYVDTVLEECISLVAHDERLSLGPNADSRGGES